MKSIYCIIALIIFLAACAPVTTSVPLVSTPAVASPTVEVAPSSIPPTEAGPKAKALRANLKSQDSMSGSPLPKPAASQTHYPRC